MKFDGFFFGLYRYCFFEKIGKELYERIITLNSNYRSKAFSKYLASNELRLSDHIIFILHK